MNISSDLSWVQPHFEDLYYFQIVCHLKNPEKTFCYEDVLIKVILDNGVYFKDYEGYEDDELFHFTFDLAKENLQKALDKDDGSLAKRIHKIIPEYNDADGDDYDVIMQTAMYGELTYS